MTDHQFTPEDRKFFDALGLDVPEGLHDSGNISQGTTLGLNVADFYEQIDATTMEQKNIDAMTWTYLQRLLVRLPAVPEHTHSDRWLVLLCFLLGACVGLALALHYYPLIAKGG